MAMSTTKLDDGAKTLAFLASHRLAATPQNYTLAYIALNDPGSPIGRAVAQIISDGYRIKQDEADDILEAHSTTTFFGAYDSKNGELSAHLRHQSLKLSELASSAADATGTFARELSEEAQADPAGSGDTSSIVARMIEHSLHAQSQLTAAMDEVRALREELEAARNDAQRDELTGLANRRAIDAHLAELAEKGDARVIALVDIDNFKSINDRYGHGVGDRVIKLVASTLEDACAPQFVGRWGGEEFIVVMPSSDLAAVVKRLNQARATLADTEFKLRETDEPMGLISFLHGESKENLPRILSSFLSARSSMTSDSVFAFAASALSPRASASLARVIASLLATSASFLISCIFVLTSALISALASSLSFLLTLFRTRFGAAFDATTSARGISSSCFFASILSFCLCSFS